MIHQRHHRIGLALAVAAALVAGILLYSRKTAKDPPIPDPAAVETAAPRSTLAPAEALAALDASLSETLELIAAAQAKGEPVKAVSVLAHVGLWRTQIAAARLSPDDQSMALQELAIIEQRSSLSQLDGALVPSDQAIIVEKMTALGRRIADARIQATAPVQ